MKNSKLQNSNSKEISNSKFQGAAMRLSGRWPVSSGNSTMVLRDEPAGERPFDLEERTAVFGETIVRFAKTIPRHPANDRLINQVVGAGTSVGANYCEASESVSNKDFRLRISTCVKEAKETRYFLRMIAASEPQLARGGAPTFSRSAGASPDFCSDLSKIIFHEYF